MNLKINLTFANLFEFTMIVFDKTYNLRKAFPSRQTFLFLPYGLFEKIDRFNYSLEAVEDENQRCDAATL